MDILAATRSHRHLRQDLYTCICEQKLDHIDATLLGKPNACNLGRWLQAVEENPPAALPAGTRQLFSRLVTEHAVFHQLAAHTVTTAQAGHRDEALHSLEPGTPYAAACNRMIATLGELYLKRKDFGPDL